MADEDYTRLACSSCASTLIRRAGRGRPRKFCEGCRPAKEPKPKEEHVWQCAGNECSSTISSLDAHGSTRYCSAECKLKATRASNRKASRKRYLPRPKALLPRHPCEVCGAPCKRHERRLCSNACRTKAYSMAALPRRAAREAEKAKRAAIRAVTALLRRIARLRAEDEKRAAPARIYEGLCPVCAHAFCSPVRRKYCSVACAKQSPPARASKRKSRKAGKARKRGLVAESFDDLEILERDGWRCQICGISTPRRLRGTYKPNAPEVDHIIPQAKGGPHSRANCQCACRRCNGAKADGAPRGQVGLFTLAP